MAKLSEEEFGNIINDFLEKVEVRMLLTMPAGTQEVTVEDDIDGGSVIQFFFLLQAAKTVTKKFREDLNDGLDDEGWTQVVDHLLGMLRAELLETEEQNDELGGLQK